MYESVGKVLFVVRAWERGRKSRRAGNVKVKVYRAVRREDLELGHRMSVGVRRTVKI